MNFSVRFGSSMLKLCKTLDRAYITLSILNSDVHGTLSPHIYFNNNTQLHLLNSHISWV
jgi:hypothetical protein